MLCWFKFLFEQLVVLNGCTNQNICKMSVQNNIPLIIPDKVIVDTLNIILRALRTNYNDSVTAGNVDESILALLLDSTAIGKYDLFANAVSIFITTPQNPKHLDVKLSYDHTSNQNFPAIFVTLPAESPTNNSIGVGEGDNPELIIARTAPETDEYRAQFTRTYLATYHVVIVAENRNEMLVLYNVLKAMLVACTNHFLMEGLLNLKIGGQDLGRMVEIPDRYFKRAITMTFQYDQISPSIVTKTIFRTIRLFWKPEGSEIAQGPIVFSNEDDINSGSSS